MANYLPSDPEPLRSEWRRMQSIQRALDPLAEWRRTIEAMKPVDPLAKWRQTMEAMRPVDPLAEARRTLEAMKPVDPLAEWRRTMDAMKPVDPLAEPRRTMEVLKPIDPLAEAQRTLDAMRPVDPLAEWRRTMEQTRKALNPWAEYQRIMGHFSSLTGGSFAATHPEAQSAMGSEASGQVELPVPSTELVLSLIAVAWTCAWLAASGFNAEALGSLFIDALSLANYFQTRRTS